MLRSRKVLYVLILFILPIFSCNKIKEIIADTLSPEIKISQEFEFVFNEYAVKRIKEEAVRLNYDTTGLNIDNLPAPVYLALKQFIKLDTVGVGSFEINQFVYNYDYALTDLDTSIKNNPGNILNFTRANIVSAKVDSTSLYLLGSSPVNQEDFKIVRIEASNKNLQVPVPVVNRTSGFVYVPVNGSSGYANLLRLPVINPEAQYKQYMIPPNDTIKYTFSVELNRAIKFSLDDKYKLAFNYKLVFKK
ncbi:MAG: hypothetical protein ACK55K_00230 [Bacteroidota bacterium]